MLLNILATYCIILPSWKDGNHNCMFCLFFVQGIIVLSLYIPLVRMSYSTDMVLDVENVRHNLIKIIMIMYWLYIFLFTYADKGVLRSNYQ